MNKESHHRIAFDPVLKRPGCVMLQAALGCNPYIAQRFPTASWLLAPTENLRVYRATPDELEKLVEMVNKKWADTAANEVAVGSSA